MYLADTCPIPHTHTHTHINMHACMHRLPLALFMIDCPGIFIDLQCPIFVYLGEVRGKIYDARRPHWAHFRWVANDYDVCHKHFINIALIFVATICYWSIMSYRVGRSDGAERCALWEIASASMKNFETIKKVQRMKAQLILCTARKWNII